MFKKCINVLALKLYSSGKVGRNWYIQMLGSDSLVDNQRVAVFGYNSRSASTSTGLSNDGKVFLNLFFLRVDIVVLCVVFYFLAS